jgi:Fe-S cluster assembly protein SufD
MKEKTMEKTYSKEWYLSLFQQMEASLNGEANSDFHKMRKEAITAFDKLDFPTHKNEEWRFTNISPLFNYNFSPADKESLKLSIADLKKYLIDGLETINIVLLNGHFSKGLTDIKNLPSRITIESFKDVVHNNPEFIQEYFSRYTKLDNAFTALNTAFAHNGTVIQIGDGFSTDKPLHIINLNGNGENSFVLSQPRNLIVTGKNCDVKIIESFYSTSESSISFSNSVSEILAGENSTIELYRIQNENYGSFNISRIQTEQKRSSKLTVYTITTGGALVRNDTNTVLNGEGCECHLYGLYLTNGTQLVDNHTLMDHAKPHCLSNELYKGILDEHSRAVFNGKVFVRKDAQKTNAYQSNKNILLSKDVNIDTKPQLEIYADDVRCTHGTTVGQLDADSVFYLRSRGLSEESARNILIEAFANDIFEEIKLDVLREKFNGMVFEKLNRHKKELKG